MKTSESIGKIAAALLKAQSSMGNASKDARNPFFKSKYADLNAIREVVTPALNSNGITVLQPTTVVDGKAFVETLLLHESGEYLSSLTEIVVGKNNDPQAAGTGISYARRYGLQSFLSVGAEDDDGESAMGRGRAFSKPAEASVPAPIAAAPQVKAPQAEAPKTAPAPAAQAPAPVARKLFNKPAPLPEVAAKPVSNSTASAADFD